MTLDDVLRLVGASICAVLATARLTRLITLDSYPPAAWLRDKWAQITHDGEWAALTTCAWCASPYIAAIVIGTAVWSGLHPVWWLATAWLSLSYLAGRQVVRDSE